MNKAKMSKAFFFQIIEERLGKLKKEVEEMKADKDMSFEERLSKENILFGSLLELSSINLCARDIDYWEYVELDEKIRAVRESI